MCQRTIGIGFRFAVFLQLQLAALARLGVDLELELDQTVENGARLRLGASSAARGTSSRLRKSSPGREASRRGPEGGSTLISDQFSKHQDHQDEESRVASSRSSFFLQRRLKLVAGASRQVVQVPQLPSDATIESCRACLRSCGQEHNLHLPAHERASLCTKFRCTEQERSCLLSWGGEELLNKLYNQAAEGRAVGEMKWAKEKWGLTQQGPPAPAHPHAITTPQQEQASGEPNSLGSCCADSSDAGFGGHNYGSSGTANGNGGPNGGGNNPSLSGGNKAPEVPEQMGAVMTSFTDLATNPPFDLASIAPDCFHRSTGGSSSSKLIRTAAAAPCLIPKGTCVHLQPGERWKACKEGIQIAPGGYLELSSGVTVETTSITVESGGVFIAGRSEAEPVEDVTISLHHENCGLDVRDEACLKNGNFKSNDGIVKIYGKKKTSWTRLLENIDGGKTTTAKVGECENWKKGDVILFAATGGLHTDGFGREKPEDNESEKRTLTKDPVVVDRPSSTMTTGTGGALALPLAGTMSTMDMLAPISTSCPTTDIHCALRYCEISFDAPLKVAKRGEWVSGIFPLQSEVANLSRAVRITGPKHEFGGLLGHQGITTMQCGTNGVMEINYARIENCGRRFRGDYCLHFHRIGECKACRFVGNAIEDGTGKLITVHGTQSSLVANNVVVNVRGSSIYVEDGNEKNTMIAFNVLVCVVKTGCLLDNAKNVPENVDSDKNEQAGMYFLSPEQEVIGNHVIGMENAHYANNEGGHGVFGLQEGRGRICQGNLPFLRFDGNNFHNNNGFGMYMLAVHPRKVKTDQNGFVSDWGSCLPYDASGKIDQAASVIVRDHFEAFQDFGLGSYVMGDVGIINYKVLGNNKGLYWKTYRRGPESVTPFCENCVFMANNQEMEGPGGTGLIDFPGSKFFASEKANGNKQMTVSVNHHCDINDVIDLGAICASHNDFRSAEFFASLEEWKSTSSRGTTSTSDDRGFGPGVRVKFWDQNLRGQPCEGKHGHCPEGYRADVLLLLKGWTLLRPNAATVFDRSACVPYEFSCRANENGCSDWLQCPGALNLRIVRVWSPDRGVLKVKNVKEGKTYEVKMLRRGGRKSEAQVLLPGGQAGKHTVFAQGYTFVVPENAELEIETGKSIFSAVPEEMREDVFVLEYSEYLLKPVTKIKILKITGFPRADMNSEEGCEVRSDHGRELLLAEGPLAGGAGAWWQCRQYKTDVDYGRDFYEPAKKFLENNQPK